MTENFPAPVLLVGYRRIESITSHLAWCARSGVRRVYIAVDGPKFGEKSLEENFIEVAKDAANQFQLEINLWIRERNLGLALSVITAIDWFFQFEERGIILEDDLSIHDSFYEYACKNLFDFQEIQNVFLISGNQFFSEYIPEEKRPICNYPLIWGWATWRDRWLEFRQSLNKDQFLDTGKIPRRISGYWSLGRIRATSRTIESWAVLLAGYMRFNSLVSVFPHQNLVSNFGQDKFASNTKESHWTLNFPLGENVRTLNIKEEVFNLNHLIEKRIYNVTILHILSPIRVHFLRTKLRIKGKEINQLSFDLKETAIPSKLNTIL